MKLKIQESLAVMLLAAPIVAAGQDITYNVDETLGAGSVVGTITTNGTIGTITKGSEIVAFSLTLTDQSLDGGPSVLISNLNGSIFGQYNKGGLSATATSLLFNYGGSGYSFIFSGPSPYDFWCGADAGSGTCNFETDPAEVIGQTSSGGNAEVLSEAGVGEKVIGTVSAVPAPTSLAMLGLGLAALGVVRRQKAG